MLKGFTRRFLPPETRAMLGEARRVGPRRSLGLAWMHWRLDLASGKPRTIRFDGYTMRIRDGLEFYVAYKDIFVHRIYHFESPREDPRVIDGGSNIGLSILYFKHVRPRARVVGFEADPVVFRDLEENVKVNRLTDVKLVHAALGARDGSVTLITDGGVGSFVSAGNGPAPAGAARVEVPCVRLSPYLDTPVDFLKLNIEGSEWEVLEECGDRLKQVREMVIEYHHLPGLPRTLHRILERLHELGFEYLIHGFDAVTNGGLIPPFHLDSGSRYFLLIYARRMS